VEERIVMRSCKPDHRERGKVDRLCAYSLRSWLTKPDNWQGGVVGPLDVVRVGVVCVVIVTGRGSTGSSRGETTIVAIVVSVGGVVRR
jgi:hypothetical protein